MRVYPELTVDGEFKTLGDLGYSGSLNDRQFSFLRAGGYTNSLTDMFGQYRSFSPAVLFALSQPGVWYDPSDLTTLFQDTAGTTPVTTPGQTVALALDKSKGLVLGSELVTNGDFSSGTGWTLGAGWTISGGLLNGATGAFSEAWTGFTTTTGATYRVTITVSRSAGSLLLYVSNGANVQISSSGTFTVLLPAGATGNRLSIGGQTFTGTIDNISVKELPGAHATQSTAASRPTYGIVPSGGRRNLLTRTEEFDNAGWSKGSLTVTPNTTVAPDGTTTADTATPSTVSGSLQQTLTLAANTAHRLSVYLKAGTSSRTNIALFDNTGGNFEGQLYVDWTAGVPSQNSVIGNATGSVFTNVGNGWYRVSVTITTDAVNTSHRVFIYPDIVVGTGNILIWGAQLETGSTATAYQRVVSAFDVTEAGVASLSYLSFDGVDDFLVTPTITPGVDKAQVFAGVRKLSDAAFGSIVESSTDPNTINGTFAVGTGTTVGDASRRTWATVLRGTTVNIGGAAVYASPDTRVVSALSDLGQATAAQEAILRLNGVQQTLSFSVADAGTGNFLAYPLYIGRRGGTTLPFNGNIFSLVVRFGANLDASTITNTERWVGGKTGVTIA